MVLHRNSLFSYGNEDRAIELKLDRKVFHRNRRAFDYSHSPYNYRTERVETGGRYWDRTSDPFHVKEVRYRCANRPFLLSCDVAVKCIEVETGFEPV
jgi:hypothetical protein